MFVGANYCCKVYAQRGLTHLLPAAEKRRRFFRRLVHLRHMDFEYASWQMLHLFIAPQKVYRNFKFRKLARSQWARDDPAFIVLLCLCILGTSLGFSFVLGFGALDTLKFLVWTLFIDCIGIGCLVATLFWFIANKCMICSKEDSIMVNSSTNTLRSRRDSVNSSVSLEDQEPLKVEWAYALDVHFNAYFPSLVILHLFQLPLLYHVILQDWFISVFIGNTFWLISSLYYIYITFLGYSVLADRYTYSSGVKALHFLQYTHKILYPMTAVVLIYVASLSVSWNLTAQMCHIYSARVKHS